MKKLHAVAAAFVALASSAAFAQYPDRPIKLIVPWAAEWFWFFEHWLVTGEWLGGGSHPVPIVPPGQTAAGLLSG